MKYAIISDIHEDIISLQKLMTQIKTSNIDKLVCLGDITGYSDLHHTHKATKNADACINLLKETCNIIVAGNHDINTANKLPSHLKRHKTANTHLQKKTWTYKGEINATLSKENMVFTNQLPEYYIEETENCQILFSHFLFPDITGSTIMIPQIKKELKPHFNFMQNQNCLLSFVGHTHINGFALSSGRSVYFKDFGYKKLSKKQQVIFCPALVNDGNKSGFVVFDTESFELSIVKNNK